MSGNTFGRRFRLTTYGESHGAGLGGIVEGCPAGLPLGEEDIQKALDERRPGDGGRGGAAGTTRKEPDRVRLLSGIFDGKTTGTSIAFHVENQNQRSSDYDLLATVFRPEHADLGFWSKYHIRDHRGGGRSSGRETLSRVAGGAIASRFLAETGIEVFACTKELGGIAASLDDVPGACARPFFCPDDNRVGLWEEAVRKAKEDGDTLGGLVHILIRGLPAGLGEPVFDKLDARLAYAFMGVGAVKGVEIGLGFAAARLRGSENNDSIVPLETGKNSAKGSGYTAACGTLPGGAGYAFAGNHSGGILGGMSTGAQVTATVAVKPISSIAREQSTIDIHGQATSILVSGRHDISAIPRIVPVLKAMAALTVADFALLQLGVKIKDYR